MKNKTEERLKNYNYLKAELNKLKNQLKGLNKGLDISISGIDYDSIKVSPTNKISDTTGDIAINRIEKIDYLEENIAMLEYKIRSIDLGLESLTEEQRKVISNYYIHNYRWYEVGKELGVTVRQCHNYKNEALKKLSGYIG